MRLCTTEAVTYTQRAGKGRDRPDKAGGAAVCDLLSRGYQVRKEQEELEGGEEGGERGEGEEPRGLSLGVWTEGQAAWVAEDIG